MKSVILLCAGLGTRFGADKMQIDLNGKPPIDHLLEIFSFADETILVVPSGKVKEYRSRYAQCKVVAGGDTRFDSAKAGLGALSPQCRLVALHDGARPFVSRALAERCFAEAAAYGCCIPALPATDSAYVTSPLSVCDRALLQLAQTPQTFQKDLISAAYRDFSGSTTDDASVYLQAFGTLHFTQGERSNVKITYPEDLPAMRIGNGFDVHPLVEGRPLILGGVTVPFEKGLQGHSDADVLTHAVMDALLSAAGEKDIGHQFPDSDPQYRGADSLKLLRRIMQPVSAKIGVQSISAVLIAQRPKLAPYLDEMRRNLAEACGIPADRIALSATTTERLGIVGEEKGMAAQAVCLAYEKL